MLTKKTLEVRWFDQGQIPDKTQEWFLQDCLGKLKQTKDTPEEREDYYLYLPECQILSFKFRQGKLEIKWRKDELGFCNLAHHCGRGKLERWVKVNSTQSHLQDILEPNQLQHQTWIKVKKKRWQKSYKHIEFEIGYLEVQQAYWWTIAAEMEESQDNPEKYFNQVLQEISQTYSENYLALENSYGYPSWLLKNL